MKHFDSPAVNSNILQRNHEHKEDQEHRQCLDFLLLKHVLQVLSEIKEKTTQDQLCRNDPRAPLANGWNVIELYKRRVQNLEAEGHGADHDLPDLRVSQVLLEQNWHCRQEEADG
jgi:hypothetical protein